MKLIIRKVNWNKANNHKYVTIPKDEDILPGDYVVVKKVLPSDLVGEASIEMPKLPKEV